MACNNRNPFRQGEVFTEMVFADGEGTGMFLDSKGRGNLKPMIML
jgi:hypothetical protein